MNNTTTPTRMRDRQPATVQEIKAQAGRLRDLMGGTALTHTQALEMVAKIHGFPTWGHLNSHLRATPGDEKTPKSSSATQPEPITDVPPLYAPPTIPVYGMETGMPLKPRTVFGLSEVEFLMRLRWHCHEGSEGLSAPDFPAMAQIVRAIAATRAHVGYHRFIHEREPINFDVLPLDEDEETTILFTRSLERKLSEEPGYDGAVHLPALTRLIEVCKWGLPKPRRALAQYSDISAIPSAEDASERPLSIARGTVTRSLVSCEHAIIFAAVQEDRFDFLEAVQASLKDDRHPLPIVDLHEYSKDAGEKCLYDLPEIALSASGGRVTDLNLLQFLRKHTGRNDLPEMRYPVDQLIYGCPRSPEQQISVRAPLVVSLQWQPHDSHLPRMLPRLRAENVFVTSMVAPAAYKADELEALKTLMENSGVWVLAPGAALPPVEGIERVRNVTRRPLMLARK